MKAFPWMLAAGLLAAALPGWADPPAEGKPGKDQQHAEAPPFKPQRKETEGSVTVAGKRIAYRAVAGTLVLTPEDLGENEQDKAFALFITKFLSQYGR